RPAPTMRTNMARSLLGGNEIFWPGLGLVARRRRGKDYAAGRLVDHVLGDLADEVVERATAAERRAATDPRWLLRGEHDQLDAATACFLDDRLAGAAGADGRRRDL